MVLSVTPKKSAGLSARGERLFARPPLLRCALFENQFECMRNRSGFINLGVAENSLLTDWLIEYYSKIHLEYSDFTYGTALSGSLRLFAALGHLFSLPQFNALTPVRREHIVAGTGCLAVIDSLVSVIADAGDGILLSKPHYNGFISAFSTRGGVEAVGVELEEGTEADESAIEAFELKLQESEARGVNIRAVMLCNPHNPLGFCYSRETLLAYCRFVEKHNLHLISDEIYALSTFSSPSSPNARPFVSILSLDVLKEAGCCPSRVHAVYGASKDWGANGLRIGALISQANPGVITAMESGALLMKVSSPADALWSGLLLDPVALPEYLKMNQAKLAEAYADAVSFLEHHRIPFRPSNAGHFIWIDLRSFLPTETLSGEPLELGMPQEEELVNRFAKAGVVVARGAAYGASVAGFFRLTFTVRPDFFQLGLGRMERALGLPITRGEKEEQTKRRISVCEEKQEKEQVEEALEEMNEALAMSFIEEK